MRRHATARLLILAALLPITAVAQNDAAGPKDGATVRVADSVAGFNAWDAEKKEWLEPEAFWESFAARSGGYTWGTGEEYPEYSKVREHDTFLVQTPRGECLMYFFHGRWRRAADVWQWGKFLKGYGGCPTVFD